MTVWSEITPRERPTNLPQAVRRQVASGAYRYMFVHEDLEVDDPALDASGRYFTSPREYGFTIRGYTGGRTAWARDFANGTMLVVNAEGVSHVLSPKLPARVLFVDMDGAVLQDTGSTPVNAGREPELVVVRLTVQATFDLAGTTPEVARSRLMRIVDRALLAAPAPGDDEPKLVDHLFESSAVMNQDRRRSTDTDFSQLLDI